MKDWVKRKIDDINELFPEDRIERSKARISPQWSESVTADRYPITYYPVTFEYYNDVHTPEERLRVSLEEFIIHGKLRDDFIPSFFPGCRQATIPNMFGSKEIVLGNDFTCEKLIQTVDDIDTLPEPKIEPGSIADSWLTMQAYLVEETDGAFQVHVTDMQGPVDVCGQIWGYDELFLCALTQPEKYHQLMEKVTRAFILLWNRQAELLGDNFVGTHLFGWNWVPENNGISVSADSLVMVSPDFYKEFYEPYFNQLGEQLNGLVVHSCGNFAQTIPPLMKNQYVKGINASQMTIRELMDAGLRREKTVVAVTTMDDAGSFFHAMKENHLQADITLFDIWPREENGNRDTLTLDGITFKPPAEWTKEDWAGIRKREAKILELLD